MSLKHGLLGLLRYGNMTGYELDKQFKGSLHSFWQAQTSQIYRELNKMEKMDWLSSTIIPQEGKPNKKSYAITDLGNEEFLNWLTDISSDEGMVIKQSFLMKIFFSVENSLDTNLEILDTFKNKCVEVVGPLKQMLEDFDDPSTPGDDRLDASYWMATDEFGIMYFDMCIEWADKTKERLTKAYG